MSSYTSDENRSFYGEELQRALAEESYGIKSYRIVTALRLKAIASVTLLESRDIHVQLNDRGYSVRPSGITSRISN
jgi:hypothetical protein